MLRKILALVIFASMGLAKAQSSSADTYSGQFLINALYKHVYENYVKNRWGSNVLTKTPCRVTTNYIPNTNMTSAVFYMEGKSKKAYASYTINVNDVYTLSGSGLGSSTEEAVYVRGKNDSLRLTDYTYTGDIELTFYPTSKNTSYCYFHGYTNR
jgi:hypothetical protein